MLCDIEKGSNLMLTRLTPVETLKQQLATTRVSTQMATFSWHLCNRCDARIKSHTHTHAKRTIIRKKLPAKSN